MQTAAPSGRTQPLWFIDNLVHVHVDGDTSGGAVAAARLATGTWPV